MFIAMLAAAAALSCSPAVVIDGDTLRCGADRVRLYGIDAPEVGHGRGGPAQPFSDAARHRLWELTRGGVRCVEAGNRRDRYGRMVAKCAGTRTPDLGRELVREGLAHDWPRYSGGTYAADQDAAQTARRGMWK